MREKWPLFKPLTNKQFRIDLNKGVRDFHRRPQPCKGRSDACDRLVERYWEMLVGCRLLDDGVSVVPRDARVSTTAGDPDFLTHDVEGRRVWVECISVRQGDEIDPLPSEGINPVSLDPIKRRLIDAFCRKLKKVSQYRKSWIIQPTDGVVLAINSGSVALAFVPDIPPCMAQVLYGHGPPAVKFNLRTGETSDAFLTRCSSIPRKVEDRDPIPLPLFGRDGAEVISAVVDAFATPWSQRRFDLFVNPQATAPLSSAWLKDVERYPQKEGDPPLA